MKYSRRRRGATKKTTTRRQRGGDWYNPMTWTLGNNNSDNVPIKKQPAEEEEQGMFAKFVKSIMPSSTEEVKPVGGKKSRRRRN